MQSGELYDSGVAKHTLFEVTDIRKVTKGDFFSECARPDRVIFGAAGYGIFQHGRMVNTAFFRTGDGIWRFFRCGWTAGYGAFPHGRVIQRFPA